MREGVLSSKDVFVCVCVCVCVKGLRWTAGSAEGEGGKEGLWNIEERSIWVRLDRCCLDLHEEIQQITQHCLNLKPPSTSTHTHTHRNT